MPEPNDEVETEMPGTAAPLVAESPLPVNDTLDPLIRSLVEQYSQASRKVPSTALLDHLQACEQLIDEAHRHFRRVSQTELVLTYTSEWVLDNYYIIRQAFRQIEEDLSPGYYRQLPKLPTDGGATGPVRPAATRVSTRSRGPCWLRVAFPSTKNGCGPY